ncbi:MAG: CofH family radical SAM protein [Hyphomicrobiales bacterium]
MALDRSPAPPAELNPPRRIGERFSHREGIEMLQKLPMGQLMSLAHSARLGRIPAETVTFVVDTNPNYTNVCATRCSFCAFHRPAGAADAYTLTPPELAAKVQAAQALGATTVLLQGGHHPGIRLADWIAYIRAIRDSCPGIHIHPFSPAEYVFMARQEKLPVRDLLERIYAEGIDTIPGGGAEILTERVRADIAPHKARVDEWLEVCTLAHAIGFRTTATMMYGHVETDADIVDHLLALRRLQDDTGGFTSFICWSFKPGSTPLGQRIKAVAHPARYVRIIALARLLLDNFPHIQSSPFSESIPAGQLGLLAGADDFGGVLIEENVLRTAGHERPTTVETVKTLIRRTGFIPAQRDSHYKILRVETGD